MFFLQRFHEFQIRKTNPEVKVIRKTLTQIYDEGKLGPGKQLLMWDIPSYYLHSYLPFANNTPKNV